jgi:hypothetical protein
LPQGRAGTLASRLNPTPASRVILRQGFTQYPVSWQMASHVVTDLEVSRGTCHFSHPVASHVVTGQEVSGGSCHFSRPVASHVVTGQEVSGGSCHFSHPVASHVVTGQEVSWGMTLEHQSRICQIEHLCSVVTGEEVSSVLSPINILERIYPIYPTMQWHLVLS